MHAFSMITDFRLKVFETVARRLNFTRAAEELFACWSIPAASSRNMKRWRKTCLPAGIRPFPVN